MSELPSIHLNAGEDGFDATPLNSSLYMHLGHLAVYNHVFIEHDATEGAETTRGTYLFATGDWFDELADFMASHGYPLHVNLRTVAQSDLAAFNTMIAQQTKDLDDFVIPEELGNDRTSEE